MSTDKTLATVKHGGCVQLGDWLPPLPASSAYGPTTGEPLFSVSKIELYAHAAVQAALSAQPSPNDQHLLAAKGALLALGYKWNGFRWENAQPSPGGQGDAAVNAMAEWLYCAESPATKEDAREWAELLLAEALPYLAARQPVGEPVTDAGRSAAYDAIDRFLRNNMDDEAYAAYVEHLEALWAAVPTQAVDLGAVRALLQRRIGQWRSHLPADTGAPGTREIETKAERDYNNDVRIYREGIAVMEEVLAKVDSQAVGK